MCKVLRTVSDIEKTPNKCSFSLLLQRHLVPSGKKGSIYCLNWNNPRYVNFTWKLEHAVGAIYHLPWDKGFYVNFRSSYLSLTLNSVDINIDCFIVPQYYSHKFHLQFYLHGTPSPATALNPQGWLLTASGPLLRVHSDLEPSALAHLCSGEFLDYRGQQSQNVGKAGFPGMSWWFHWP